MIKIYNLSSKIDQLKNNIENFKELNNHINLKNVIYYRFFNSQEILMYNGRQVIYSCSIQGYKDKIYITKVYDQNSKLVFNYDINYDNL